MSNTKPGKRQRVSTDPGLGRPKVTTTPGPPEVEPFEVDRGALTPPDASPPLSPSPRPVAMRFGGEPTPLPPEATEGLLTGLIESENEAYFRKTKPAPESSGEAAAAFHAVPQVVHPGIATPLPEPAVMLDTSVERDIAQAASSASRSAIAAQIAELEETRRIARRGMASSDPTATLGPPRSTWADKWIAFGVAVVTVAAIGIVGVHWFLAGIAVTPAPGKMGKTPSASEAPAAIASEMPATVAIPAATPIATVTPAITAPTPTPVPSPAPTPAPVVAVVPARTRPKGEAGPPRATGAVGRPLRAGGGPSAPSAPPPKDDVKRSM